MIGAQSLFKDAAKKLKILDQVIPQKVQATPLKRSEILRREKAHEELEELLLHLHKHQIEPDSAQACSVKPEFDYETFKKVTV